MISTYKWNKVRIAAITDCKRIKIYNRITQCFIKGRAKMHILIHIDTHFSFSIWLLIWIINFIRFYLCGEKHKQFVWIGFVDISSTKYFFTFIPPISVSYMLKPKKNIFNNSILQILCTLYLQMFTQIILQTNYLSKTEAKRTVCLLSKLKAVMRINSE